MNNIDKNISVGEVVVVIPKAAQLFKTVGIDYCCGGHKLLAEVIQEKGLDEAEIYGQLEKALVERQQRYDGQEGDFDKMSQPVLSAYIEDTHHAYLRKALPKAAELLSTVVRVHGKNHRELYEMYQLFGRLKTELEQHLLKEETLLFPIFDLASKEGSQDEIMEITKELIAEHEGAGELLRKLREVSKDYRLPDGACGTFQRAYALLEEIEQDIHQHVHLENNILFKAYSLK